MVNIPLIKIIIIFLLIYKYIFEGSILEKKQIELRLNFNFL